MRPFPGTTGGRWQVSNGGGTEPRWSPDGRELFYLDGTARLTAATIGVSKVGLEVGEPRTLFDASGFVIDPFHTAYEVMAGGRAFLFPRQRQQDRVSGPPPVVEAENWFADVRRKMAR